MYIRFINACHGLGLGGTSGIEDIDAAANNAPVEYYNLQGVRVANPTNGLYIRRQGSTATKVLIR